MISRTNKNYSTFKYMVHTTHTLEMQRQIKITAYKIFN